MSEHHSDGAESIANGHKSGDLNDELPEINDFGGEEDVSVVRFYKKVFNCGIN